MAIKVKVDKMSEFLWMEAVISQGCLKPDNIVKYFKKRGVPLKHTITYEKSSDFENDVIEQPLDEELLYKEETSKIIKEDKIDE